MGGQQDKFAVAPDSTAVLSDHTPIFGCFEEGANGLSVEEACAHRDRIASYFVRRVVPNGASIFSHKVGLRDLVIVEKGGLRMVSYKAGSANGRDSAKNRTVIKVVGENEMLGLVELVQNVEQEADEATGRMPTDVLAQGKTYLLVLSQDKYIKEMMAKRDSDVACGLFCDNLLNLTKDKVLAWLNKVSVLQSLGKPALRKLADVAHFRSLPGGKVVLKQGDRAERLHVILSGSLDVACKSDMRKTIVGQRDSTTHDGKKQVVVGNLHEGDFFGESALLSTEDSERGAVPLTSTASVLSTTQCLFIYFDTQELRARLEEMPEVMEKINAYIKNRLTGQLLAMNLSLFEAMRPASVALFTANLVVQTFNDGETVFAKGSKGTDFYVLIQGSVEIAVDEDENVVLDKKGSYFGELALIREEPRAAAVKARGATILARISGANFKKLCLGSPSVAAEFEIKALGTKASVGAMLVHPRTAPLLKASLDKELATENDECWDAIEAFRFAAETAADDKLAEQALAIYKKWIDTTTDDQVNLSGKVTRALKTYFDGAKLCRIQPLVWVVLTKLQTL
ncbi:hypothetical protein JL720_11856 [Aureococcus anophagefferens]|nr:hypothetical protein JL720_11856 [Aureococcus anophagefferens]